ncbi:2-phosphosulfolactate phosphatase family protein [Spirulina subsalsa FACHB-351]|uniref:Probable 2-phosphosulfolactate phosphatase n=1 Tax=Spirulina subsalsa FACHB-351 TaxID=234711 RepID=A0ABT3L2Y1_9CYAN|nr:2-phosphosulfolactate phosphatase family protein [Spirulina subsalsa]MCW6035861.1 2-phosphosulfolactate phosphatase family protein [Spirulina subsalsa FACHB-351]
MKLFVYHTPELTPTDHNPDCAVVIDVLRATTTIATALNAGAEAVQAFSDINQLMTVSEAWAADRRIRAGERGGKQVEGCDMGNSPLLCTPEQVQGKRLFISTTNGTRTLQRVENAPVVLTGAQVNRQAVVDYLSQHQPETVWLVGSGWEGAYSLEDTVCAGAIALPFYEQNPAIVGNDEVLGAVSLYRQWQDQLVELFCQASHGQRLLRLDLLDDIKYCAQTDLLNVLPLQVEKGLLTLKS